MKKGENSSTVIVLGAGASTAEGAPLQADLFRDYFKSYRVRPPGALHSEMDVELRTYFDSLWGIDIDRCNLDETAFPTFEEAIGILELAHARGEFFRDFGGLNPHTGRGQEVRQWLVALIASIIQEKLEPANDFHRRLIRNLPRGAEGVSFVSLNYDILIDNAIIAAGYGSDYGMEVRGEPSLIRNTRAIGLYKIHGSLNWLYCPCCGEIDVYQGEKIAANIIEQTLRRECEHCQEQRVSVVVPPTFFKNMSNPFLVSVWGQAERALRDATRIVFCGYSFPDADLHFKYLLKRAEVNRSTPLPAISVVNEHAGKTKSVRDNEKARYLRFFQSKSRVQWTDLSFEQFARNPMTVLNGPPAERGTGAIKE